MSQVMEASYQPPIEAQVHIRALFAVAEVLHDPSTRDLRRAPRESVEIPLRIYGRGADGNAFYAEARTINVSETGALLLVNSTLSVGDQILITNRKNSKERLATVVRFGSRREGFEEVGVALQVPDAGFWNSLKARHAEETSNGNSPSSRRSKSETWIRLGAR